MIDLNPLTELDRIRRGGLVPRGDVVVQLDGAALSVGYAIALPTSTRAALWDWRPVAGLSVIVSFTASTSYTALRGACAAILAANPRSLQAWCVEAGAFAFLKFGGYRKWNTQTP